MALHKEIIDNSDGNKLVSFLNDALKENGKGNFDIATAFFNIGGFAMIKDSLDQSVKFRLLLAKAPEIQNDTTLGDVLLEEIKKEVEGFDLSKDSDTTVRLFIEFLKRDADPQRLFGLGRRRRLGRTHVSGLAATAEETCNRNAKDEERFE